MEDGAVGAMRVAGRRVGGLAGWRVDSVEALVKLTRGRDVSVAASLDPIGG